MALCDISIELENSTRRFAGGDTVRGVVHLKVNEACTCKELSVRLAWSTMGFGDPTGESVAELELYSGEWETGDVLRYPFEFTLPNGPCSYIGHALRVNWGIFARADIAWASAIKCSKGILMSRSAQAPPQTYSTGPLRAGQVAQDRSTQIAMISLILFFTSIGITFTGLWVLYEGFFNPPSGQSPAIPAAFGSFILLFGLGLGIYVMRTEIAVMRLGNFRIDWPREIMASGDKIPVSVYVENARNLNGVEAWLLCRELSISQRGEHRRASLQELFMEPIELQERLEDSASDAPKKGVYMEGEIMLPKGVVPCFYATDNEVSWLVEVRLDIPLCPDWKEECYLDIRPRAGEAVDISVLPREDDEGGIMGGGELFS